MNTFDSFKPRNQEKTISPTYSNKFFPWTLISEVFWVMSADADVKGASELKAFSGIATLVMYLPHPGGPRGGTVLLPKPSCRVWGWGVRAHTHTFLLIVLSIVSFESVSPFGFSFINRLSPSLNFLTHHCL